MAGQVFVETTMRHWFLIPLWCVAAGLAFSIGLAMVTVRVSPEHFAGEQPGSLRGRDPNVVALQLGPAQLGWLGVAIAIPLTVAARAADRPEWTIGRMIKPVLGLLGVTFCLAVVGLVTGYSLSRGGMLEPPGGVPEFVRRNARDRYVGVWLAVQVSVAVAVVGSLVLAGMIWRRRGIELAEELRF